MHAGRASITQESAPAMSPTRQLQFMMAWGERRQQPEPRTRKSQARGPAEAATAVEVVEKASLSGGGGGGSGQMMVFVPRTAWHGLPEGFKEEVVAAAAAASATAATADKAEPRTDQLISDESAASAQSMCGGRHQQQQRLQHAEVLRDPMEIAALLRRINMGRMAGRSSDEEDKSYESRLRREIRDDLLGELDKQGRWDARLNDTTCDSQDEELRHVLQTSCDRRGDQRSDKTSDRRIRTSSWGGGLLEALTLRVKGRAAAPALPTAKAAAAAAPTSGGSGWRWRISDSDDDNTDSSSDSSYSGHHHQDERGARGGCRWRKSRLQHANANADPMADAGVTSGGGVGGASTEESEEADTADKCQELAEQHQPLSLGQIHQTVNEEARRIVLERLSQSSDHDESTGGSVGSSDSGRQSRQFNDAGRHGRFSTALIKDLGGATVLKQLERMQQPPPDPENKFNASNAVSAASSSRQQRMLARRCRQSRVRNSHNHSELDMDTA